MELKRALAAAVSPVTNDFNRTNMELKLIKYSKRSGSGREILIAPIWN